MFNLKFQTRDLAVLVPLVGLGWLYPGWSVLLFMLVVALLVRRAEGHAHLHFSLPIVLSVFPGVLLYPDVFRMSGAYLLHAVSGILLVRIALSITRGNRISLLLLALLWAFFPSGLGLLGVLLAAFVRSEALAEVQFRSPALPAVLLGMAAGVVLLGALVPAPPTAQWARHLNVQVLYGVSEESGPVGPQTAPLGSSKNVPETPADLGGTSLNLKGPRDGTLPVYMYWLFLVSFLGIALGLYLFRGRAFRFFKMRPSDAVLLLAIVGVLVAVTVYSTLSSGLTSGSAEAPEQIQMPLRDPQQLPSEQSLETAPPVQEAPEKPEQEGFNFWWTLFALPVAGTLWVILKYRREAREPRALPSKAGQDLPPESVTLEGVRKVYLDFLHLMEQQGIGRTPEMTPLEFSRRVLGVFPQFVSEVEAITGAYLPVRYGSLPALTQFAGALEALQSLQQHFELQKGQP